MVRHVEFHFQSTAMTVTGKQLIHFEPLAGLLFCKLDFTMFRRSSRGKRIYKCMHNGCGGEVHLVSKEFTGHLVKEHNHKWVDAQKGDGRALFFISKADELLRIDQFSFSLKSPGALYSYDVVARYTRGVMPYFDLKEDEYVALRRIEKFTRDGLVDEPKCEATLLQSNAVYRIEFGVRKQKKSRWDAL